LKGFFIMAKDKEIQLKIRPLDDRVVVEPLEAEDKTTGGILLPDTAKQKPQRGRVLAVGPGKMRDNGERMPVAVAKGDEVIYGRYSGSDIEVDRKEIKILRESDILAKVVK
jgi:chaperonin GroES